MKKRFKILVVDDSEVVREMVKLMLEEFEFDVEVLDSAFGLSGAMVRHKPDLVLMDVAMPALQGDKAVEIALRNELSGCPIVLHSDRSDAELASLARRSGARGFIHKTGDSLTLARAVRQFLSAVR